MIRNFSKYLLELCDARILAVSKKIGLESYFSKNIIKISVFLADVKLTDSKFNTNYEKVQSENEIFSSGFQ